MKVIKSGQNEFSYIYLGSKQIKQIEKAFRIFDQDCSGQITIAEFNQVLKSLGHTLPQDQLNILISTFDKDGNGVINFQQFLDLVAPTIIQNRTEKNYIDTFRIIDYKNDGILDKEQLDRANLIAGQLLTQKDIDQIMIYVEKKYKGLLNINSILSMLLRKPKLII